MKMELFSTESDKYGILQCIPAWTNYFKQINVMIKVNGHNGWC